MMRALAVAVFLVCSCKFTPASIYVDDASVDANDPVDARVADVAADADGIVDASVCDKRQMDSAVIDAQEIPDAAPDAYEPIDAAIIPDAVIVPDAVPDAAVDPCNGLVATYSTFYGSIDYCNSDGSNDTATGSYVIDDKTLFFTYPGGIPTIVAPAGVCQIMCFTAVGHISRLPDGCSGTWDVGVGGPSSWLGSGCNNLGDAFTGFKGCNSDRSCEDPAYP